MKHVMALTGGVAGTSAAATAGRGLGGAWSRWLDRRAAVRALSRLSDRELDDLGMTRGDIETVVDGLLARRAATAAVDAGPPRPCAAPVLHGA